MDIEKQENIKSKVDYAWFVGASGNDDKGDWQDFSDWCIAQGIWVNNYDNTYLDKVKSIKIGDKIALKSAYVMKNNLPFEASGKNVGVMKIKAIGVVTNNNNDGKNIKVNWTKCSDTKIWYGPGSLRSTIHLVKASDSETKKELLEFTFNNIAQDYVKCAEKYAEYTELDGIIDESISQGFIVTNKNKIKYTIAELAQILADTYNAKMTTGIHLFGIKYGKIIKESGFAATDIIKKSGINESYHTEVSKGIRIYEALINNNFGMRFYEEANIIKNAEEKIELTYNTNYKSNFDYNRIVFGAPGTGKSFLLDKDRRSIVSSEDQFERVTFHPEYSYSSFVGCYKPVSENGNIIYKYVPGPFLRVLVKALKSGLNDTQSKPYLLLIEEINRANVASVFGEVFQLLDRDNNGVSQYEIHASEDMKKYLAEELGGDFNSFSHIKLPNNMFIWASMNSADQGVFHMDTAFKRRWSFEHIGIDENDEEIVGNVLIGKDEYAKKVNWNHLRKAINAILVSKFRINEDKLIGPFFIGKDICECDSNGDISNPNKFLKIFKNKLIMYLYEDVAKQFRHKLFSGCTDNATYSSICLEFDEKGIGIFGPEFKVE